MNKSKILRKLKRWGIKILFIIFLFFLWWIIYKLQIWPRWLFPSPFKVFKSIKYGLERGTIIWGIIISMKRIAIGFGFSLVAGSILGFLLAKNKLLDQTVGFLILGLQTLPSICWLPLALLWFGLNEQAIIFVIIMGAILSITISLGAKGFKLYQYIIFPAILPSFITGIKHGWSFAWRSLMSGEMLFITVGLGQLLMMGRELNDMAQVMAVMLIIIAIGIIFDKLIFGFAEDVLRKRWGYK